MQVATASRLLVAEPGQTVDLVIDVVNTSDLIDGVSARVIGLPDTAVLCDPQMLPLFPEASGQVRVSITVPSTTPAGVHPLSVEIHSHAGTGTQHLDLDLSVAAHPAIELRPDPPRVRARRSGQFLVEVQNTGNTGLSVAMGCEREDRRTQVFFTPEEFTSEPGASTPVIVRVKGPRMFTGGEVERRVTVDLRARRLHTIAAMLETEPEPELRSQTVLVLRQRPLIGRGLLTALILIAIVTLWALAFLLGLTQVFSGDAMTKTAPTTFPISLTSKAAKQAIAEGKTPEGAAAPGAAPPGALPKTGLVPAKVGGSISGTIRATTDNTPVGRIMVRAYREGRNGPVQVSSAASQSDGSYTLAGLFPTEYRVTFTAKGFETLWYPRAAGRRGATPVEVDPQGATKGVDVLVTGLTASISGTIDPGDATTPPPTTVTARMVGGTTPGTAPGTASGTTDPAAPVSAPSATSGRSAGSGGSGRSGGAGIVTAGFVTTPHQSPSGGSAVRPVTTPPGGVVARTVSDGSGAWSLDNLPSPATYELSFEADGYRVTKVLTKVSGGEARLQPAVVPGAVTGSIQGLVTSKNVPVGNVKVSTTVAGEPVAVTTPTVGQVGAFNLANLPTPGTYVITFTSPGHGSTTQIVDLAAGATRTGLRIDLAAGTGTVSGKVTAPDLTGLGGVKVTVGGATDAGTTAGGTGASDPTQGLSPSTSPSTTTLTSGDVGAFSISGLAPGEYTLTFELAGYAPEAVPVQIGSTGAVTGLEVVLGTQLGTISGAVTGPAGNAYVGATITVTNGARTWTTTSTGTGGSLPTGGYLVQGLEPGTYSVTVTANGLRQQTAMVTVYAGIESVQKLRLGSL